MILKVIMEYNEQGCLLYADAYPGAFTRGRTLQEALRKIDDEIVSYRKWLTFDEQVWEHSSIIKIIQKEYSTLPIHEADTGILFDSEKAVLTIEEYQQIKQIALKSAQDFLTLYQSIPNRHGTMQKPRKTFYGEVPLSAEAMYEHTKSVNSYYFRGIQVMVKDAADIYQRRVAGFERLEAQPDFLKNEIYVDIHQEAWNVRKVCRRFIWHDRIHARAMYRMAKQLCPKTDIADPFFFDEVN